MTEPFWQNKQKKCFFIIIIIYIYIYIFFKFEILYLKWKDVKKPEKSASRYNTAILPMSCSSKTKGRDMEISKKELENW